MSIYDELIWTDTFIKRDNSLICHRLEKYCALNPHADLTCIAVRFLLPLEFKRDCTKPPNTTGQNVFGKHHDKQGWNHSTASAVDTRSTLSAAHLFWRISKSSLELTVNAQLSRLTGVDISFSNSTLLSLSAPCMWDTMWSRTFHIWLSISTKKGVSKQRCYLCETHIT